MRAMNPRAKVLVAGLAVGASATAFAPKVTRGANAGDSLRVMMAAEGLDVREVLFVDEGPLGTREALVVARRAREPSDVYACRARFAGDAGLALIHVANLTNTAAADERGLVRAGEKVGFVSVARERVDALHVLALEGDDPSMMRGWSRVDVWKDAITTYLATGRTRGFGAQRIAIEPDAARGRLVAAGGTLVAELDGERVSLDGETSRLRLTVARKSRPAGITWLVDTVRSLSFVGPEPIAWLENRVYGLRDRLLRLRYRFAPPPVEREPEANQALRAQRVARVRELGAVGFPPDTLTPVISGHPGDGQWLPIVDDPFVGQYPRAAPAFAETILHVDPARPFAKAHVVVWDPRQVQMRAVSGTREPESATGALGPGMIPRDRTRLPRLVAGFNGGFQAMHGEFGMMAERVVYLPPKPFAATVVVRSDGRVSMGSWVGLPAGRRYYTEQAALAQIPPDVVDLRQNLTTVVEDDRINPWQRWYWGAANVNATEQTFVDRSALCVTREGFVAYFWGNSMGPEQLGRAMTATRCRRGMHLDMNAKHTQFEYYRVREGAPAADEVANEMQFAVPYPGVEGLSVRGRLFADGMQPQEFPRYVEVDARDFFYLELRPTLPGPDLPGGIRFEVAGLPQPAYPWAFAKGRAGEVTLLRIDLSRAVAAGERAASVGAPTVEPVAAGSFGVGDAMTADAGTTEGGGAVPRAQGPLAVLSYSGTGLALVITPRTVGFEVRVVVTEAPDDRVLVRGPRADASSTYVLGVDAEGFALYAEGPGAAAALAAAGVTDVLSLAGPISVCDAAGCETLGGDPAPASGGAALELVARTAPYADVLNEDVTPRPYSAWGAIQDTRVRYVPPEGPRRFQQGGSPTQ